MKTTENISLGGYAFTIETDAYNELDTYLNEVRKAFSTDPNADEIIADIEERIAELLKEQTVPGMVVSLPMIKEIKKRIGNPAELAQDEAERPEDQPDAQKQKRILRRNRKRRTGKAKGFTEISTIAYSEAYAQVSAHISG